MEEPQSGPLEQVSKSVHELPGLPHIKIEMFEDVPYVQVRSSDSRRLIFDWSCTEALNVAILLIEAAGTGHNARIAMLESPESVRGGSTVNTDSGGAYSGSECP
jgi:hypothetical protein